jgi:hypothetical protein
VVVFGISAIALLGRDTAALVYSHRSNPIEVKVSRPVAIILFQWIPTWFVSLYTWFWQDYSLYTATTQAFRNLGKGADAKETLLLDYGCMPRNFLIVKAIQNGHVRVSFTAVLALLQRLLPIFVGASIAIRTDIDLGITTLQLSRPLLYLIGLWLIMYIGWIVYEILMWDYSRYLSRNYTSIADLLSWTYSSRLLRSDTGMEDASVKIVGNVLDMSTLEAESDEPPRERWHMTCRLRLAKKKYRLGLTTLYNNSNMHTIGIYEYEEGVDQPILEEPATYGLLGSLRRRKRKRTGVRGTVTRSYSVKGSRRYERINAKGGEKEFNTQSTRYIGPVQEEDE